MKDLTCVHNIAKLILELDLEHALGVVRVGGA